MINTKVFGTKTLAASLALAAALTIGAPVNVMTTRTIVNAATASTYDTNLGTALTMQVGQKQTVTFPTATTVDGKTLDKYVVKTTDNETVGLATTNTADGAVKVAEDKKAATTEYVPGSSDKISFNAKKAGKATITITSIAGNQEVGVQTIEVTVTAPTTELTATQTVKSLSTNEELKADGTVTVYKGEVAQIAIKTKNEATLNAFSQSVSDTSVADVIKNATGKTYGQIAAAANPEDPSYSNGTYTLNFEAKKAGTTEVTVTQAAASDGSSAETSFRFKINVIERDGELSVNYDADHDGKNETYRATYYKGSEFVSGDEEGRTEKTPQAVALDLKKNTTLQVTGTSENGQAVSYSSSNNDIATISNTGLITARKTGRTTITISTAGSSTSKLITSKISFTVNVSENEAAYITVKDAAGEIIASSAGTYTGSEVPSITVGKAIKTDDQALDAIRSKGTDATDASRTIILSTKDRLSTTILVSSNSSNYLTAKSDDTGIVTYKDGTIRAVKAGQTTITLATTQNPDVVSTSTITLNVYVTDKKVENTVTADSVTVDGAHKTAVIGAKAAYGTVVYDTKVYTDDEKGEKKAATASDVTVDAKGNVTYAPKSGSGTVYARVWADNSDEALGTDYLFVPIKYSENAANEIIVEGLNADNSVELTSGSSTTFAVSSSDAAATFQAESSNSGIALAAMENGRLTITGVAEGTVTVTVTGKAGTAGYADPSPKTIAVHVSNGTQAETPTETEPTETPETTVASQKVTFKNVSKTYKADAATQKLAAAKTFYVTKNPTYKSSELGKVTYSVTKYAAGSKNKVTVSKKGKVTVKKGAAVGTYKVKVTVAKKGTFKKTSKTITIKVTKK